MTRTLALAQGCVCGDHHGALVAALEEAFPGGAGARLTVKMVPYADAAARPYLDPHWRERLARLAAQGMRVDVLDEVIPEDGMASL